MSEVHASSPRVTAVSASSTHSFSKVNQMNIRLIAGLGVAGDAHAGATVKHRSRVAKNPADANLRQVHLIHSELHDELNARGFNVGPGAIGENITTRGIDLLALPVNTELRTGNQTVIRVTGLRNPCVQIDRFQKGLMEAVLDRTAFGQLIRKAGVMAVVVEGGDVL
jgi:MOSC domain-containing protein YiiM